MFVYCCSCLKEVRTCILLHLLYLACSNNPIYWETLPRIFSQNFLWSYAPCLQIFRKLWLKEQLDPQSLHPAPEIALRSSPCHIFNICCVTRIASFITVGMFVQQTHTYHLADKHKHIEELYKLLLLLLNWWESKKRIWHCLQDKISPLPYQSLNQLYCLAFGLFSQTLH